MLATFDWGFNMEYIEKRIAQLEFLVASNRQHMLRQIRRRDPDKSYAKARELFRYAIALNGLRDVQIDAKGKS